MTPETESQLREDIRQNIAKLVPSCHTLFKQMYWASVPGLAFENCLKTNLGTIIDYLPPDRLENARNQVHRTLGKPEFRVILEEDAACPLCEKGKLEHKRDGSCSCHISPPCSACVDSHLWCPSCGFVPDEIEHETNSSGATNTQPELKPIQATPDHPIRIHNVREHTAATQEVLGHCLPSVTTEQLHNRCKGSFGGRINFRRTDGHFSYIAYTD